MVSHKFETADMRGCKFFEEQSVSTTIRSQLGMVQRSAMKAFWNYWRISLPRLCRLI